MTHSLADLPASADTSIAIINAAWLVSGQDSAIARRILEAPTPIEIRRVIDTATCEGLYDVAGLYWPTANGDLTQNHGG